MLLVSHQNSIGLGVGHYEVWFLTDSFIMDSSRRHEAGAAGARPPAHRALCRRHGRPTALTQVLFTGAAFCGCLIAPATIQCVIQNCWWEALLLAGREPSLIHEILLAVDSMHQVSPGTKPQGSRGRRLCGLFCLTFISHVATPCQAWAWSRQRDLPPHS